MHFSHSGRLGGELEKREGVHSHEQILITVDSFERRSNTRSPVDPHVRCGRSGRSPPSRARRLRSRRGGRSSTSKFRRLDLREGERGGSPSGLEGTTCVLKGCPHLLYL